jgi:glycosyltransferase involved in cell wall biosynthesis
MTCLGAAGPVPGVTIDVHPSWNLTRGFAVSPAHARALASKAETADIVHNHSLWQMVNVAAGYAVPGRRALLVNSPRGTLAPEALALSRGRKRLIWPLQRRALARAALLHATSEEESAQIRAQGFRAPVAVIPNGIDLPEPAPAPPAGRLRTLLYLGRLHPIKALDRLLAAWAQVAPRHPGWQLIIAGPGESPHVAPLKEQAAALALPRISFPGPVYGGAKAEAYRAASLFILPSRSENFGMSVAEALSHGVPAIVSRGAPWSGLEPERAGWWVENSVEGLAAALDSALPLSRATLAAMGARGRAWMARDFGWPGIAERMEAAYAFALGRAARPDWVTL